MRNSEVVAGFRFSSAVDGDNHDGYICQIIKRVEMPDQGFGIEPSFRVRFNDGLQQDVLAQQLTPWYPV